MSPSRSYRFFWALTARPWLAISVSLLVAAVAGAFASGLTKDTRNKAYVSPTHPAMAALDHVEAGFSVSDDPIIVALLRDGEDGVFHPATLAAIHWLSEEIRKVPGVDPERLSSLSTERYIRAVGDEIRIDRFFEEPPTTRAAALRVREAALGFPLYVDSLVSRDGRATAIVVELLHERHGEQVYRRILELIDAAPRGDEEIHVAGLGAYNALIGDYIDRDMERLNPIAGLIVALALVLSYRTLRGTAVPLIAVAGGVAGAFGSMAAAGIPLYGITGSMGVILIAIGVCDGTHIMGQYYAEVATRPGAPPRELATRTLAAMWRPIAITSLTTVAGFLALSASSALPPMRWYGVFAALGVLAAMLLCLVLVPAGLALLTPRSSPAFRAPPAGGELRADVFGRATAALGRLVHSRPRAVGATWVAVLLVAAVGALRLERDNDFNAYLNSNEPLHQAEIAINEALGGIQTLDVLIEATEYEGLYEPELLRRIDALQRFMETLPRVRSTRSLVDYLKQMSRSLHDGDPQYYAVPEDPVTVAQLFLAYSAQGDPEDLAAVVDLEFRQALVRASFDRARWSDTRDAVPAVESYLAGHFRDGEARATLSGFVNVGYHLDREIERSQLIGVSLAFVAVWGVTAGCFGSALAGALAMLPVALAVLLVYAVMGFSGIWLNLGTSMTGAIAVGVAVDFSIHTLDRLIHLIRDRGWTYADAYASLFASTGRALLFNFAAILLGFSVLLVSAVPTLREFGVLIASCVAASFVASVTLLPALLCLLRPRFLSAPARDDGRPHVSAGRHTRALSGRRLE